METPFEIGAGRYQANPAYIYATDAKLRFDQRQLASMVGYVAFGLPFVLGVGGLVTGEFRSSMSNYYYEPLLFGDIFVGFLVFIGALLLAYRGWTPKVAQLATIAGVAAFLVALFPHQGWEEMCHARHALEPGQAPCEPPAALEWASPVVHFAAALALFLVLAFFCLFVFTKVEPHQAYHGPREQAKRRRDGIYRMSGFVILAAIASIAAGKLLFPDRSETLHLVYWMEFLALVAFGVSWIVQGRASGTLLLDERDRRDVNLALAREAHAEMREEAA